MGSTTRRKACSRSDDTRPFQKSNTSDFATALDTATELRWDTEQVNFIRDLRPPLDVSQDISRLFQETGIEGSSVTIDVQVVPEFSTRLLAVPGFSLLPGQQRRRC
jgi:hypothetical protein